MMKSQHTINRNFPWCDEFDESSFMSILHEQSTWDDEEYFKLECALFELSSSNKFNQELAWRIFRIFSHTSLLFISHHDENDKFEVKNKVQDEIYDLRERFQLVFEGYFSGKMPNSKYLAPSNKLLSEYLAQSSSNSDTP